MLNRLLESICILVASSCTLLAQTAPIQPAEAPGHMTVPDGFHVSLFAGEPEVVQPIAFTFDDRGRLWVAENFSYPHWTTDGKPGHDRILIFDDPDGTGRFKTRKVFADNLTNVSGLELGFGGVWVCSTPNLIFIPMKDDQPSGPAQVLLDGWSLEARHNVFNRLTWGPDGWLYGCNGILATSHVGKPGAPDSERVAMNCGVWRYHPTQHVFEVYASGTTNPWGLDFNDVGQMFITNCVVKHLFHVIQGAHYKRMYGSDLQPNVYGLIESCADHTHFAGDWTDARKPTGLGQNTSYGGGHAHAGAMVYLGDNWPDSYRDSIFMVNIHGARVNNDLLEHKGSGYVGRHAPDFLLANDPWFRGLNLAYGPDGGVFLSDWTDTGECHNSDHVDQSNGCIYKVVYQKTSPAHADVEHATDEQLVAMQLHHNDWFVRHARRVLQERAAAGTLKPATSALLEKILTENPDGTRKLRAIWALQSIGSLTEERRLALLTSPEEYIRAWAIQLSAEQGIPAATLSRFRELAATDPSPVVRLYLASALQRLPLAQRWDIALALGAHAEDATDQNIPLMLWYGIEPLAAADHDRAADLLVHCKIPLIRQDIARRIAQ